MDRVSPPIAVDEGRDLVVLANAINEEHQKCEAAARDALQHALRVGELLLKAKARVSHARRGDLENV